MPTPLQTDTATVLAALASYRTEYAATGHASDFPDRTVSLTEGAVILSTTASLVCAFAQGHRFDGERMLDRGVIFTRNGDDDVVDARLARIVAHRAHLIARERAGHRGR